MSDTPDGLTLSQGMAALRELLQDDLAGMTAEDFLRDVRGEEMPPPAPDEMIRLMVALAAEMARLRAALTEAEAALLNERGEGEPPSKGWASSLQNGVFRWRRALPSGRTLMVAPSLFGPGWVYLYRPFDDTDTDTDTDDEHPTARAAMRAADAAVREKP